MFLLRHSNIVVAFVFAIAHLPIFPKRTKKHRWRWVHQTQIFVLVVTLAFVQVKLHVKSLCVNLYDRRREFLCSLQLEVSVWVYFVSRVLWRVLGCCWKADKEWDRDGCWPQHRKLLLPRPVIQKLYTLDPIMHLMIFCLFQAQWKVAVLEYSLQRAARNNFSACISSAKFSCCLRRKFPLSWFYHQFNPRVLHSSACICDLVRK